MTRKEQLKFCKVCINSKMNREKGLICKLTDAQAKFEIECKDFKSDTINVEIETNKR